MAPSPSPSPCSHGIPMGLRTLHKIHGGRPFSFPFYKASVLLLTFLSYTCYHAARKPPSIVKGVLHPETNNLDTNSNSLDPDLPRAGGQENVPRGYCRESLENLGNPLNSALKNKVMVTWMAAEEEGRQSKQESEIDKDPNGIAGSFSNFSKKLWRVAGAENSDIINSVGNISSIGGKWGGVQEPGWPPFDQKNGKILLGEIDIAFLLSYSFGMYFSGQLADRMDLRIFLSLGMIGSGIACCLHGMGYFWNIHTLWYFIPISMLGGFFQSSGWPSCVSIMANWYGKEKRGLIMGVWNAHTSIGNISGSLLAAYALKWGWGFSFLLPGSWICLSGIIVFLFLLPEPKLLRGSSAKPGEAEGLLPPSHVAAVPNNDLDSNLDSYLVKESCEGGDNTLGETAASGSNGETEEGRSASAVGFVEAWRIPGVAAFAFCLFFAKLVAYTFLDWLPFYIGHEKIGGVYLSTSVAGMASTIYDVGGVGGGILAGHLSDTFQAQACVSAIYMLLAIPLMGSYFLFGHISLPLNLLLLSLTGVLVNGPYALITCAVSADLGQHSSLKGNSKALATVAAIIDGTGSVGAALGPFLTGLIAQVGGEFGWAGVFGMLMVSCLMASLCLSRLVVKELSEHYLKWRESVGAGEGGRSRDEL